MKRNDLKALYFAILTQNLMLHTYSDAIFYILAVLHIIAYYFLCGWNEYLSLWIFVPLAILFAALIYLLTA